MSSTIGRFQASRRTAQQPTQDQINQLVRELEESGVDESEVSRFVLYMAEKMARNINAGGSQAQTDFIMNNLGSVDMSNLVYSMAKNMAIVASNEGLQAGVIFLVKHMGIDAIYEEFR